MNHSATAADIRLGKERVEMSDAQIIAAWVGGIVTVLSAVTAAAVTIINAIRGADRNKKRVEQEGVISKNVENVAKKASEIHEQTFSNQFALETALETANRHIKQQEMLLMVLLREKGLADILPGETPTPQVVVVGGPDEGIVVVGGIRYRITKTNGPVKEKSD